MKRGLGPLSAVAVVERARSAIGRATTYRLGSGGRDPHAKHPGALCDCSGFVAWALGVDRYLPNAIADYMPGSEWFETSALVHDARSPFGFVVEVEWDMALPGDIVVWGDHGGRQGHVGVVSEVENGPAKVIHCSSGNFKLYGDAIRETGAEVFYAHRAIVARVRWVKHEEVA